MSCIILTPNHYGSDDESNSFTPDREAFMVSSDEPPHDGKQNLKKKAVTPGIRTVQHSANKCKPMPSSNLLLTQMQQATSINSCAMIVTTLNKAMLGTDVEALYTPTIY